MTILQALARQYERLHEKGSVPPPGYSRENISYAIALSVDGTPVDVMPLVRTDAQRKYPRQLDVPRRLPRSSNTQPFFLWDKTAYAIGVKLEKKTRKPIYAEDEHSAFKKFHEDLLVDTEDEGLQALATFLRRWNPRNYRNLPYADEMLDLNVVFRLDQDRQKFLHDRPIARSIWLDYLEKIESDDSTRQICLVTGKRDPVARLHTKLKNFKGGQPSGASIVSFNFNACESFGKTQGDNAPVSIPAMLAYTTALDALLDGTSRQQIRLGDTRVVYWAEATKNELEAKAAESLFSELFEPITDEEETVVVSHTLKDIANGKPLETVKPDVQEDTTFFVLALAPNVARISIRFWHRDTIGSYAERIVQHWKDLRLDPPPWRVSPTAWDVVSQTGRYYRKKKQDRWRLDYESIPPRLCGELLWAILLGRRYPTILLSTLIARMRSDKNIDGRRVAICKACLARDHRLGFEKEDVPVSLNPNEPNIAYRLGRLFAVYESVQRVASDGALNATIKDRYFGAASAIPASIFPLLERNSAHHLASLRKGDKQGLAHWFEQEIDTILAGVDTAFPRSLRLQDQGRFVLGYHHQRARKGDGSKSNETSTERET